MTLEDLAALLDALTVSAEHSRDPDVLKAAVVLSALLGTIDTGGPPDRAMLDALATHAGQLAHQRASSGGRD
jgi:hypothetical protein